MQKQAKSINNYSRGASVFIMFLTKGKHVQQNI